MVKVEFHEWRDTLPKVVVPKNVSVVPDQRSLDRADEVPGHLGDINDIAGVMHRGVKRPAGASSVTCTQAFGCLPDTNCAPLAVRLHVDTRRRGKCLPRLRETLEPNPLKADDVHRTSICASLAEPALNRLLASLWSERLAIRRAPCGDKARPSRTTQP